MPSLIENILALETNASEIVARAHAETEAIAKRTDNEIAAARAALVAETTAKLAALEQATNDRCRRDLADVETESQAACAAVAGVTSTVIENYAATIAAAFAQG